MPKLPSGGIDHSLLNIKPGALRPAPQPEPPPPLAEPGPDGIRRDASGAVDWSRGNIVAGGYQPPAIDRPVKEGAVDWSHLNR